MNIQKLTAPKLGNEIFPSEPVMSQEQKDHRVAIMAKAKRHFADMKYFDIGDKIATKSALIEMTNNLEEYSIEAVRYGFDAYSKSPRLSEEHKNPQAPSSYDIRFRIQKRIDEATAKSNEQKRIDMVVHMASQGNLPSFIDDRDLVLALAVNAIDFEAIINCKRAIPTYLADRVTEKREEMATNQLSIANALSQEVAQ